MGNAKTRKSERRLRNRATFGVLWPIYAANNPLPHQRWRKEKAAESRGLIWIQRPFNGVGIDQKLGFHAEVAILGCVLPTI
ncbi:hypothetical protein [Blastopirellula retiformator]|uniref:hypothetical protein n=1 Tax=Blastopirellula retiformator TaxID=2527970 RepID=UPI0011B5E7D0|nr:hypothetical protein [Blastopirellula retiformator]